MRVSCGNTFRIDCVSFTCPGSPGRIPDLNGVIKGVGTVRGVLTGAPAGVRKTEGLGVETAVLRGVEGVAMPVGRRKGTFVAVEKPVLGFSGEFTKPNAGVLLIKGDRKGFCFIFN